MTITILGQQYKEWMQYGRPEPVTKATVETITRVFRVFVKYLGDCEVTHIDKEKLQNLRMMMTEKGNTSDYIEKVLIYMRSFLKYCREERSLPVLKPNKVYLPKREEKEIKHLNKEEVDKLLQYCNSAEELYDLRISAIIALMLDSGLRMNELLGLNRDSIKGDCVYFKGKGRKLGVVFFHDWSLIILQRYLAMRTDDHPALFVRHLENLSTERLIDTQVRFKLHELSQKIGIEFSAHVLRKTAGTQAWRNSRDLFGTQSFLRHKRTSTTTTYYIGLDEELLREFHHKNITYGSSVEEMTFDVLELST